MIDSEMNGNAKKILKNLLLSPIERDCYEFRRVLKSINIDENILIEIFLSRSNKQIQAVINNYFKCKFKRFVSFFFYSLNISSIQNYSRTRYHQY